MSTMYASLVVTGAEEYGTGYRNLSLAGPFESAEDADRVDTRPHLVIPMVSPEGLEPEEDDWDRNAHDKYGDKLCAIVLWARGGSFDLIGPFASFASARTFRYGAELETVGEDDTPDCIIGLTPVDLFEGPLAP